MPCRISLFYLQFLHQAISCRISALAQTRHDFGAKKDADTRTAPPYVFEHTRRWFPRLRRCAKVFACLTIGRGRVWYICPFCVPCPVKPRDPNGVLEVCQIFLIIYKVYSGDCFDIPRIRATQSPIWRKHCVVCYFCNNAMLEKATIPQCTTCGKPLCPNCWGEWHAV